MKKRGEIIINRTTGVILVLLVVLTIGILIFPKLVTYGGIFGSQVNESDNKVTNFLTQIGLIKTKNSGTTAIGKLTPKTINGRTYYFSFLCNVATASCDQLNATIKDDKREPLECNGEEYTLFDNNTMFCCDNLKICAEAFVDNDYKVHYNAFAIHEINEKTYLSFNEGLILLFKNEKYKIILNNFGHAWVGTTSSHSGYSKKYYNFLIITPDKREVKCSANIKKVPTRYYCICNNNNLGFRINILKKYPGDGCDLNITQGTPEKGKDVNSEDGPHAG